MGELRAVAKSKPFHRDTLRFLISQSGWEEISDRDRLGVLRFRCRVSQCPDWKKCKKCALKFEMKRIKESLVERSYEESWRPIPL